MDDLFTKKVLTPKLHFNLFDISILEGMVLEFMPRM